MSSQICPQGTPYRCIMNGQCVQSTMECIYDLGFDQTTVKQVFLGILIDRTCPTHSIIRCANGNCVNRYSKCLTTLTGTAITSPVAWGANVTSPVTCQVYCTDGSCRDA
jgi:hypothetical protein